MADIRQRFGNSLQLDGCLGSECSYTVTLSNRILAALHIVPYTELQSYFRTRDGVVLGNMLNDTTTVKRRHRIVSHVQIDFCKGCVYIAVHPWDATSPLDTNGIVQIGNESSAQSLRTALSLNTDCFTKYDGCQSVADMLPTVWKQTVEMKIAEVGIIRSHGNNREKQQHRDEHRQDADRDHSFRSPVSGLTTARFANLLREAGRSGLRVFARTT